MPYFYVFVTIIFTVIGQLLLKWRMSLIAFHSAGFSQKILFLLKLIFTDRYVFLGFVCAFLASLTWLNALNKLDLNIAYPMLSLSFVFVFALSAFFFHEKILLIQVLGLVFIILGVSLIGIAKSM